MDIQEDKDFAALPEVAKLYQACKERDLTIAEREYLKGARDAWQAAKAQAVPEGFVVVPKEPTQELLNKMQDFFVGAFENGLTGGQSIHCAYIAMIEAQEPTND